MKKFIIVCALTGIGISVTGHEPLDSVYDSLSKRPGSTITEVKYSGGFTEGCPGFIFLRAEGAGWTTGTRLCVDGADEQQAAQIFKVFDDSREAVGHVSTNKKFRACFDEKNMKGYAAAYDPETHKLYFMQADVESQLCIPADWTTRNYYYVATPASVNWTAALARLYTEVKYNSAFYDKFATRLDSVYYASLEELKGADDFESYRILQKAVAACEDGHTYIYTAGGFFETPGTSPFTTVLLGDKLYVRTVESEELEKAGMKRGMEIVSVNGESPQEYAARELRPYVCASTPQWADYLTFDGYEFSRGRNGAPLNLTLSADGGKHLIEIKHTINGAKWQPEKAINVKKGFRKTKDNVAVLTLPNFASSDITDFFDSVYPQILESDALIIDLRGNGGGNSGYADYILRHLTKDPIATNRWRTPIHNPAFASWHRQKEWYEAPSGTMNPVNDAEPYLGPVAVLTDRGTFSAAEDFCAVFKGMNRGPIVGTPTGGSTGNGVRVMLSLGLSANICSKHDTMPDGTEFVGIGIIPDVIIEETPESYFTEGRDDVLEKAISTLKRK